MQPHPADGQKRSDKFHPILRPHGSVEQRQDLAYDTARPQARGKTRRASDNQCRLGIKWLAL